MDFVASSSISKTSTTNDHLMGHHVFTTQYILHWVPVNSGKLKGENGNLHSLNTSKNFLGGTFFWRCCVLLTIMALVLLSKMRFTQDWGLRK